MSDARKTVLVTGASSGFGFHTARAMARAGAHVILACRAGPRGIAARDAIERESPGAAVELLEVDLADQRSLRAFVDRMRSTHERLDVLVNNAGVYLPARELTADGIERCFATNVLAYHVLIRELADLLARAAPSRIIDVASDFAGDLDLDDLQFVRRRYDGQKAYRQSKACDRLLTWAWARKLESRGITVNAVAPGLVMTDLYRHTGTFLRGFMHVLARFIGRSVEEGADTAIWLATATQVEGITGKFFDRRTEKPCQFADPQLEGRLFDICERLTAGPNASPDP